MLTVVFAEKTSGGNYLNLPLANPLIVEDTPERLEGQQENRGSLRFLRNETRPVLQHQLEGFSPPLLYVYESVRQTSEYTFSPGEMEERVRVVTQQKFVTYHLPLDLASYAMAIGDLAHVKQGFKVLSDGLSVAPYEAPHFEPIEFDIPRIKAELADNQWFRRVGRERGVGIIMHGPRIEDDPIYNSLDADSTENDVGVIFSGNGADLKIKLVTQGRIQFWNFRSEHLIEGHPQLGAIWPYIIDVIQYFLPYKR